jgi:hypothetical protein
VYADRRLVEQDPEAVDVDPRFPQYGFPAGPLS